MDIKYLPRMPDEKERRYLFVAIDRATRWVFMHIYADQSEQSSVDFLNRLERAAPMKIVKLLTDNGSQFTDRFTSKKREPTGCHDFDVRCTTLNIEHRLCPPRHPQTNGMVERFNGRISEVVNQTRFASAAELETTLKRYVNTYNQQIPQRALNHLSPIQALKEWQKKKPELFKKRIYNQAGLDIYSTHQTELYTGSKNLGIAYGAIIENVTGGPSSDTVYDNKVDNVINCHLGNGASVCAIRNGESVDTSMGLTPLEGLAMGTRSGDIDPAVVFFMHDQLGYSVDEINQVLTRESGLLGMTEASSDCRYVTTNYATDAGAKRALDVFTYRVAKYVGAYAAAMDGRLDALVFTGGIGENAAMVREMVLARLALFGFKVDKEANNAAVLGGEGPITAEGSRLALVMPTNEELVIARDALSLVG
jgi:IS1 family transposase